MTADLNIHEVHNQPITNLFRQKFVTIAGQSTEKKVSMHGWIHVWNEVMHRRRWVSISNNDLPIRFREQFSLCDVVDADCDVILSPRNRNRMPLSIVNRMLHSDLEGFPHVKNKPHVTRGHFDGSVNPLLEFFQILGGWKLWGGLKHEDHGVFLSRFQLQRISFVFGSPIQLQYN